MLSIGSNRLSRRLTSWLYKFGVWPNQNKPSTAYKFYAHFVQLFFSFGYTVCLSGAVFESSDIQEATVSIPLSLSCILICTRISNFYLNNRSLQERLHEIHKFELWNADEQSFIESRLKGFSTLAMAFTVTIYVCLSTQLIVPLFLSDSSLPLPIWFPIDWQHNPLHFWIVYVYSSMAIFVIGHMVMLLQVYTCYLMFMNTVKFEVLGIRMKNLGHRHGYITKRLRKNFLQKNLLDSLINCVKCHRKIVTNIRRIENNFSLIFSLQISCSSIVICSGTYILAYSSPQESQFQIVVHIALIGYYLFDIFLTMFFGNLITLKSDALGSCLYQSNWPDQSMQFRRTALVVFERLRNPTKILVGKLVPLSLNTFSSILSTAYRLFSVITNMEDNIF